MHKNLISKLLTLTMILSMPLSVCYAGGSQSTMSYNNSEYMTSTIMPFMVAARNGDTDKVRQLLDDNIVNVNIRDNYGRTALVYATLNGKTEVVKELLKREADVDATGPYDDRPLELAIQKGYPDIVYELEQHGAKRPSKFLTDLFTVSALTVRTAQLGYCD